MRRGSRCSTPSGVASRRRPCPSGRSLRRSWVGTGILAQRTLNLVKIDADKDKKTATLYGINAYPTVVLETPEGSYEFDKPRDRRESPSLPSQPSWPGT
jgi:hypothetical protein